MMETIFQAERLALATVVLGLLIGGSALWLGLSEGSIALWGFGAACLLQVPPALSLRGRVREGLGNSGLERERVTLRVVSHFLRLLGMAMAMAAVSALLGERGPQVNGFIVSLALLACGLVAGLWYTKLSLKEVHPTLALDAARTRSLVTLAGLLLAGILLGHWVLWADASASLAQALWLFVEANSLSKATTYQVACGGCGGGCG